MTCFSEILAKTEEFSALKNSIAAGRASVGAIGLPDVNKAHTVHALCAETGKKAFVITPDEASAIRFYEDLSQLQGGVLVTVEIYGLPDTQSDCSGGVYGFHIHEGGECGGNESDPFADAKNHFNPNPTQNYTDSIF